MKTAAKGSTEFEYLLIVPHSAHTQTHPSPSSFPTF